MTTELQDIRLTQRIKIPFDVAEYKAAKGYKYADAPVFVSRYNSPYLLALHICQLCRFGSLHYCRGGCLTYTLNERTQYGEVHLYFFQDDLAPLEELRKLCTSKKQSKPHPSLNAVIKEIKEILGGRDGLKRTETMEF